MKVYDLGCPGGHGFEGWFGSEDDFASQSARGLVECPLCGSTDVQRRPSAPRLNLRGAVGPAGERAEAERSGPSPAGATGAPGGPGVAHAESVAGGAVPAHLQAAFLKAMRHVLATTEDVGPRFAAEARRIHHGESPERAIRGQATAQERQALEDEGIDVMPLPIPPALRGETH